MSKKLNQEDFIGAGFDRVDHVIEAHPPKIKWGDLYLNKSPKQRLEYAEKLAATMNHAASKIQEERDELNVLCEKKEKQIEALKLAVDQNNQMIQGEITRMNSERQQYNEAIANLKREVRELSNGTRH